MPTNRIRLHGMGQVLVYAHIFPPDSTGVRVFALPSARSTQDPEVVTPLTIGAQ